MSNDTMNTEQAVCILAGDHVKSLLATHFDALRDAAIRAAEKSGKSPVVKVAFAIAFCPTSATPQVKTKIRATSSLSDEAEDYADPRQLKIDGVDTDSR